MFIVYVGGHKTTANTLTFAITMLACFPQTQKKLQAALDDVLGQRLPSEWNFEKEFPTLLSGYVGAFINEILRIFAILPFIPKGTEDHAQRLTIDGHSCLVPPDTLILINTAACHRNPKYWPAKPTKPHSDGERSPFPAATFNVEQWMEGTFSPTRGAFIPFSEGSRVCIGQRLAKVELVAVLARIFRDCSVELAVNTGNIGNTSREQI